MEEDRRQRDHRNPGQSRKSTGWRFLPQEPQVFSKTPGMVVPQFAQAPSRIR
jgi:hypothetical protein